MATKTKARKQNYETLQELLLLKLGSLLDIEEQITKALPKMAKAASDETLRSGFTEHLRQTEGQIDRLNQAFEKLEAPAKKVRVEAIRGLAADTDWIIKSVKNPEARDALLAASAQYVEHYEMAGYGAACEWATELGHDEVADLLQETLDEEVETAEKLEAMAADEINGKVQSGKEEDEDEKDA